MVQALEHLPYNCNALSLNISAAKKKKSWLSQKENDPDVKRKDKNK
jgi:hypothetical protein